MYDSQHRSEETQLQLQRLMSCQLMGLLSFVTVTHTRQGRPCNKVQLLTNILLSPVFLRQLHFSAVASTFPVLGPWSELPKYLLVPEPRVCICLFYRFREKPLVLQGRGDILHSCIVLTVKPVSLILHKTIKRKAIVILLQVKCHLKCREGITIVDS